LSAIASQQRGVLEELDALTAPVGSRVDEVKKRQAEP
jgi:hypothetical protein